MPGVDPTAAAAAAPSTAHAAAHTAAHTAADRTAREAYGRLLALLAWRTGDLAAAEDALADAFAAALATWPVRGVPDNPEGWLVTTARHRHLDQLRSAAHRHETALPTEELEALADATGADGSRPEDQRDRLPDRRLQLMLVCAHPAIAAEVHAPLMLQAVLGIDAAAIARAFVMPEATLAQRLVRAKRKIREAGIRFELPDRGVLPGRMEPLLEAVYAAHAIGWEAADDAEADLSDEARYLAALLLRLAPGDAEVLGLNALLALSGARRSAQRSAQGQYIPLSEQDTAQWDHRLIAWGEDLLGQAHAVARAAAQARRPGTAPPLPGRFQLEAAIQSVHVARARTGHTDWAALALLYEGLMRRAPGLGTAVGRAVAIGHHHGADQGLAALDRIEPAARQAYQPAWAARAALLAGSGQRAAADQAYLQAMALARSPAVRAWLELQRQALINQPG